MLVLAEHEARGFKHNYIGTEHLLLGVIREEEGVAATVLVHLGVELTKVRSAVEHMIGRGDRTVKGEIGLTPRAERAIELGRDEARRLGHRYVGTEHILLGLIREGEGMAAAILESLGVNIEEVRSQVIKVLSGTASLRPHLPAASPPRSHSGYQYLVAEMQTAGHAALAVTICGGDEAFDFDSGGESLHDVLDRLGDDGWELAGIDRPDGQTALYIFKRQRP